MTIWAQNTNFTGLSGVAAEYNGTPTKAAPADAGLTEANGFVPGGAIPAQVLNQLLFDSDPGGFTTLLAVDVQEFTSDGEYVRPVNAVSIVAQQVLLVGAGAAGRAGKVSTTGAGGSGGAGGFCRSVSLFQGEEIPDGATVTVGATATSQIYSPPTSAYPLGFRLTALKLPTAVVYAGAETTTYDSLYNVTGAGDPNDPQLIHVADDNAEPKSVVPAFVSGLFAPPMLGVSNLASADWASATGALRGYASGAVTTGGALARAGGGAAGAYPGVTAGNGADGTGTLSASGSNGGTGYGAGGGGGGTSGTTAGAGGAGAPGIVRIVTLYQFYAGT